MVNREDKYKEGIEKLTKEMAVLISPLSIFAIDFLRIAKVGDIYHCPICLKEIQVGEDCNKEKYISCCVTWWYKKNEPINGK